MIRYQTFLSVSVLQNDQMKTTLFNQYKLLSSIYFDTGCTGSVQNIFSHFCWKIIFCATISRQLFKDLTATFLENKQFLPQNLTPFQFNSMKNQDSFLISRIYR